MTRLQMKIGRPLRNIPINLEKGKEELSNLRKMMRTI